MKKRIISFFMALFMVITTMPISIGDIFAATISKDGFEIDDTTIKEREIYSQEEDIPVQLKKTNENAIANTGGNANLKIEEPTIELAADLKYNGTEQKLVTVTSTVEGVKILYCITIMKKLQSNIHYM